MIICIDFDGTCVTHEYPNVGRSIGAETVLQDLSHNGYKFILFTMRSGKELQDAVDWFEEHSIPLFGVNENPDQKSWTDSPKPYGNIYIDDAALGVPLITPEDGSRDYVNWDAVAEHFNILIK